MSNNAKRSNAYQRPQRKKVRYEDNKKDWVYQRAPIYAPVAAGKLKTVADEYAGKEPRMMRHSMDYAHYMETIMSIIEMGQSGYGIEVASELLSRKESIYALNRVVPNATVIAEIGPKPGKKTGGKKGKGPTTSKSTSVSGGLGDSDEEEEVDLEEQIKRWEEEIEFHATTWTREETGVAFH
jgi:hypothetical protein